MITRVQLRNGKGPSHATPETAYVSQKRRRADSNRCSRRDASFGPNEAGLDAYCHWLSRFFFVAGYEPEDIYQEARLAMWLAPEGLERVAAYRRVVEILRRSKRGGRPTFCELHEEHAIRDDVADIAVARERVRELARIGLSDLEREALGCVVRGEACPKGPLDNALQRARRKLAA